MRKLLLLTIAAITVAASVTPAEAATRSYGYRGQRNGMFARLMELERRKNAWLFGSR
jgi:hypothetical protein